MKMRIWINSLGFLNITRGKRGSTSFTPCYVDLAGAAPALLICASSAYTSRDWLSPGNAWRRDRSSGGPLAIAEMGGYALARVAALRPRCVAVACRDGPDFAREDRYTGM